MESPPPDLHPLLRRPDIGRGSCTRLPELGQAPPQADGWKYTMTKEEQWDKLGYVVRDRPRVPLLRGRGAVGLLSTSAGRATRCDDMRNSAKDDLLIERIPKRR